MKKEITVTLPISFMEDVTLLDALDFYVRRGELNISGAERAVSVYRKFENAFKAANNEWCKAHPDEK
jgi:hypothetical protein